MSNAKKMTKSEITAYYVDGILEEFEGQEINERTAKKLVQLQQEMFEELIAIHLAEKGCPGQFTVPGLFTIKAQYKPAVKGGDMVRSPFSGEMVERKPKDASVKVRIVPMKKTKDIALEGLSTHRVRAKQEARAKAERAAQREASAGTTKRRTKSSRAAKSSDASTRSTRATAKRKSTGSAKRTGAKAKRTRQA